MSGKWSPSATGWPRLAEMEAEKSRCHRAQVGCVLTQEDRFIAGGWNQHVGGSVCPGPDTPTEPGQVIHAELAAVLAVRRPAYLVGAVAWVTHSPCVNCAALLAYVGVKEVNYGIPFRDTTGISRLIELGVTVGPW